MEFQPVGIYHIAILVDVELAGAGIEGSAGGILHLEESISIHGQIEHVACGLQRSLGEIGLNAGQEDSEAAGGARPPAYAGTHDIGEIRAAGLEPDGARIGDVVADDGEIGAVGI